MLSAFSNGNSFGIDQREITFPADVAAWGWMDVTRGGSAVVTDGTPNSGCPDAVRNLSDVDSVNQTTSAIQCRLNVLGASNPGSLYFPSGAYYVNKPLALKSGSWKHNADSTWTFMRSPFFSNVGRHISGQDPLTTQIIWAGDCGVEADIPVGSANVKYNDMLYINGISPLSIERLTLDGKNCAGSAIDLVSKPQDVTGVTINEMNIQNFKEVGILGDRPDMTNDELRKGVDSSGQPFSEADLTGMVSEVTITKVNFAHIDHACVMPNAYNALDWWVRDSSFTDCNVGVKVGSGGSEWVWPGQPVFKALPWTDNGPGGVQVASSNFFNSRSADIVGGNSVRNSFSIGGRGPFLEVSGNFLAQGNTVISGKGVVPVVSWGGSAGLNVSQVLLFQNKFLTQGNSPAILMWTKAWGISYPQAGLRGVSASFGNVWNETYSSVVSIGNQYSSSLPFANASGTTVRNNPDWINTVTNWAPLATSIFQCGPVGAGNVLIDNRTFCNFPAPSFTPVYNVLAFDDQLGIPVTAQSYTPPPLPAVRPLVPRKYIVAKLNSVNSAEAAAANTQLLQKSVDELAAQQGQCAANDTQCPDRWNILFLPTGIFPIATTIHIPGSIRLQIVGTGSSALYWFEYKQPITGPSPIFRFHSPAHVMMRDLTLIGSNDNNFPNPEGEGIIAEVTDLATSRIITEAVRTDGQFSVNGIGNAAFEMRTFGSGGPGLILGNNGANLGYFAFFGGNPSNLTVGQGANLMLQDTWYEGGNSNYVECRDGDHANITAESSNIAMGGWHGVSASTKTSFTIGSCQAKIAILSNFLVRDGWYGLAPTASISLSAQADPQTQVLLLGNSSSNSNYLTGQSKLPTSETMPVDQGYFTFDPNTQAKYASLVGNFYQATTNSSNVSSGDNLSSKNEGSMDPSFLRSTLSQAFDPRQASPMRIITPINDMASTDILIERVQISGTRSDIQFVLPGQPGT